MASNTSAIEGRVIADFNRGKIDSKKAAKLLKKMAARKGRKSTRGNWK